MRHAGNTWPVLKLEKGCVLSSPRAVNKLVTGLTRSLTDIIKDLCHMNSCLNMKADVNVHLYGHNIGDYSLCKQTDLDIVHCVNH